MNPGEAVAAGGCAVIATGREKGVGLIVSDLPLLVEKKIFCAMALGKAKTYTSTRPEHRDGRETG